MVWYEKLMGYRTWDLSCGPNYVSPTEAKCDSYNTTCPFKDNRYANCPTQYDSMFQSFDFASDPVLQIHSDSSENLYVIQQNGVVYSIKAKRELDLDAGANQMDGNDRFLWATHVFQGSGMGGLAADKKYVYFTLGNKEGDPWYHDDGYDSVYCGGWGALSTYDGLPGWYKTHPLCDGNYDYFWVADRTGSFAPPTVTNDALLVACSDRPISSHPHCPINCTNDCGSPTDSSSYGGTLYVSSTKDGEITSSYQTGAALYRQGLSLHGKCVFTGDGYLESKNYEKGTNLYAWCVSPNVISKEY